MQPDCSVGVLACISRFRLLAMPRLCVLICACGRMQTWIPCTHTSRACAKGQHSFCPEFAPAQSHATIDRRTARRNFRPKRCAYCATISLSAADCDAPWQTVQSILVNLFVRLFVRSGNECRLMREYIACVLIGVRQSSQ